MRRGLVLDYDADGDEPVACLLAHRGREKLACTPQLLSHVHETSVGNREGMPIYTELIIVEIEGKAIMLYGSEEVGMHMTAFPYVFLTYLWEACLPFAVDLIQPIEDDLMQQAEIVRLIMGVGPFLLRENVERGFGVRE